MIEVIVNDKQRFNVPQAWNELTSRQLADVAPFIFKPEITLADRTKIAYHICGFGYDVLRHNNEFLCQEILIKVLPLITFLFEKINLTRQVTTEIKVGRKFQFFGTRMLYGPADNFDNLTIAEFSDCESCLTEYQQSKDVIWLNRFIAILYRPRNKSADPAKPGYTGDLRQPYNFYLNDLIAAMVEKIPDGVKMGVMLWYVGCRTSLTTDYQFLFNSKSDKGAEGGSWTDLIHGLSGPKFGTIDQTMTANLKVVFKELTILHKQAAELETLNP